MVTITICCQHCGSKELVRNGYAPDGKQRYCCKTCKRQSRENPDPNGYKEGYIDEEEFQGEMAAVELALRQLDAPEVDGVTYAEVIEAGEHLPGMAALWDVATVEERGDDHPGARWLIL